MLLNLKKEKEKEVLLQIRTKGTMVLKQTNEARSIKFVVFYTGILDQKQADVIQPSTSSIPKYDQLN